MQCGKTDLVRQKTSVLKTFEPGQKPPCKSKMSMPALPHKTLFENNISCVLFLEIGFTTRDILCYLCVVKLISFIEIGFTSQDIFREQYFMW